MEFNENQRGRLMEVNDVRVVADVIYRYVTTASIKLRYCLVKIIFTQKE